MINPWLWVFGVFGLFLMIFHLVIDRVRDRAHKAGYEAGFKAGETRGRAAVDNWWIRAEENIEEQRHQMRKRA